MLVEAPSLSTVMKLSAVTVLFVVGSRMSTSPAADPEAVIVRVPMDEPAEFFLYIPFEETYAYAILKGKLNEQEIRMKPKERWYRSSAVTGDEEYTIHPADVSKLSAGVDPYDDNYFFHAEAFVF